MNFVHKARRFFIISLFVTVPHSDVHTSITVETLRYEPLMVAYMLQPIRFHFTSISYHFIFLYYFTLNYDPNMFCEVSMTFDHLIVHP